jgi:hypothetical protein
VTDVMDATQVAVAMEVVAMAELKVEIAVTVAT